jgi:hypothetical protein
VEAGAAHTGEQWGTVLAVGGTLVFTAGISIAGNLSPCFWQSDAIPATSFSRTNIDAAEIATGPVTTALSGGIYYVFYLSTLYNGSFTVVIQDQLRFFTTPDFVTFTGPLVYYDQLVDPPVGNPTPAPNQFLHTLSLIGPGPDFSVVTALEFTPYCAGYFLLGGGTPPPPVTPVSPPSIGGGGPSALPFNGPWVSPFAASAEYKSTNAFDHCLCRQRHVWDCMDWTQAACCTPPDYTLLGFGEDLDTEEFDGVAPFQRGVQIGGVRFYKTSAILCPAAISGDVLALNFQIPVGYDAVISGLVLSYAGAGFVEGSGDLIWRVKLNRRWAKDFGNIQNSLGTVQTPYPTQILAGSLSNVQVYVNAPNTSGGLQPGVIRILVQVLGWWFPSDEMARFQKLRAA